MLKQLNNLTYIIIVTLKTLISNFVDNMKELEIIKIVYIYKVYRGKIDYNYARNCYNKRKVRFA